MMWLLRLLGGRRRRYDPSTSCPRCGTSELPVEESTGVYCPRCYSNLSAHFAGLVPPGWTA